MSETAKTILQRLISILLIFVFALNITPATVLHDLFFDHTDYDVVHNHKHANEVAKAGVNCHFNSFVCQPNFVPLFTSIKLNPPDNTAGCLIFRMVNFYSLHHFYAELRGPPTERSTIACLS